MNLKDIKVVGKPLVKAKSGDVDRMEKEYWIKFPSGYREYVTSLGEGVLGSCVRIYPPWKIANELADWRDRIRQYWFWDAGHKVMAKDRAIECYIVGDTIEGDELVFHPGKPDQLFILPRDSEKIFVAGSDLLAAIEWMCSSGKLGPKVKERNFEPFDSRKSPPASTVQKAAATDPPGESMKELLGATERWAKRHKLLQDARKWLDTGFKIPDEQIDISPGRCSLVFKPEKLEFAGFYVKFTVSDKKSGLEVGVREFHKGEDSQGGHFTPNQKNYQQLKTLYGTRSIFDGD